MVEMSKEIVLGAGCFWCSEAAYSMIPGVLSTMPGYAGGTTPNPSYEQVCTGETGHAEVVRVEYDPSRISLDELLDIFVTIHDPTSLNRQDGDVGIQYRSIVLYSSEEDRERVKAYLAKVQKEFRLPLVTEVKPLEVFYPAEEYHRQYFKAHPTESYCRVVIAPKLKKVEKKARIKA
jgi:peptide-methionine (S)-S-oxide reductase